MSDVMQNDEVIRVLSTAGYRPLQLPLKVKSISFDFVAAFVGANKIPDLVVLIDMVSESESRIKGKIEGLARALDVSGSRRPLTAIFTGPRPSADVVEAISRVARPLLIASDTGHSTAEDIFDRLSVLLPLEIPEVSREGPDAMCELRQALGEKSKDSIAEDLLIASRFGQKNVEARLRSLLLQPLNLIDSGS